MEVQKDGLFGICALLTGFFQIPPEKRYKNSGLCVLPCCGVTPVFSEAADDRLTLSRRIIRRIFR